MIKNKTLGKKILFAMTALVLGLLLVAIGIFGLTIRKASETLSESNQHLSETIVGESSETMNSSAEYAQLRPLPSRFTTIPSSIPPGPFHFLIREMTAD